MADDRYWTPGPEQDPYRDGIGKLFHFAYPGRGRADATGRMLQPAPAAISLDDLQREAATVMPKARTPRVAGRTKEAKETQEEHVPPASTPEERTTHIDPTGPPSRIAIPEPGDRVLKKPPLPDPTDAPVDPDEMFKVLDYDPDGLWGDAKTWAEQRVRSERDAEEISSQAEYLAARYVRTDKNGKPQTGNGDAQVAVRHAIGAIIAAREYGPDRAKLILDRHERKPDKYFTPQEPVGNQLQDLYNNRVGMDAARDPNNRSKSAEEIALDLYEAGKLQERPFSTNR